MQLKDVSTFVEKLDQAKKINPADLSQDEDLSIAIMNLISIEEHFFFTYGKTEKPEYIDLLHEVRTMRTGLLKKIIKEYEGEVWCISKHLLAASMRLFEVGTKARSMQKMGEAQDFFKKAFDLYSLFWGLVMKVINVDGVKKINDDSISKLELAPETKQEKTLPPENISEKKEEHTSIMSRLGDFVKKAVDCCRE
jgi:hypothetical protein